MFWEEQKMNLKDMSKEELELMSYDDLAYLILQDEKKKMKIIKKYNPEYKAYENKGYKILEFIEHITAPVQNRLF